MSYDFITNLLSIAWNSIPQWIKLLFSILLIISIIGSFLMKGIDKFFNKIWSLIRNFFYPLSITINNFNECKRIQTLINWKKNDSKSKGNYKSKKVKIKNVYKKKEEKNFIIASKKGYITVIKKRMGDNKSDNLLDSTILWVMIDYLSEIRRYISPDLTTALVYKEIIIKLEEMKDFEALKKFIKIFEKSNQQIKELINKLDELSIENILSNLYIPYIKNLKSFNIADTTNTKKESELLIDWFTNYKGRLTNHTTFRHFPRTSFLYVRLTGKPISNHIHMAINKFENKKSDVLVISGWKTIGKSAYRVTKILKSNYGYKFIKSFEGKRLFKIDHIINIEERYCDRLNYIMTKKDFDFKF